MFVCAHVVAAASVVSLYQQVLRLKEKVRIAVVCDIVSEESAEGSSVRRLLDGYSCLDYYAQFCLVDVVCFVD